jgi:GNAT superfamily N-acetyltransferase
METNGYLIQPLTPDRWDDFVTLFGPHGAVGGCWCMFWRREGAWQAKNGDVYRERMHALVEGGTVTGLLAYNGDQAVGWVSVAPRTDYAALARSRVLAPVDTQPVWSIVCFFIHRRWRKKGVMRVLLRGAVDYAAAHGAQVVEAYPMEKEGVLADVSSYMGVMKPFLDEGFVEVARRSEHHVVVRKTVKL